MSEETETQSIPENLAGQRLDQALARMFPEYSRSRLKLWIQKGLVAVDGRAMLPKDKVSGGETVQLTREPEIAVESEPEPVPFGVVYEDRDLLVVDKPADLVVHPGAGNPRGTLMNGLLYRFAELSELPRAGIIHRLDKGTSGLLLVARTLEAHTKLVRQLAERRISRRYAAVCAGVLTGGGTIDAPIGRHRVDRLRMSVRDDGKAAVTRYRVLTRFRAHTYISVELETGRTHQIRVHFSYRRHALVGDPVYGGRLALPAGASPELGEVLRGFRRQALHAVRLELEHPVGAGTLDVEAPLPADFEELLGALERDAGARR